MRLLYWFPAWRRRALLKARRVAVVRTDALGDLILTLPTLAALRSRLPNAELHLICRSYTEPVASAVSCVDKVDLIDRVEGGLRAIFRQGRFDVAFFPRARPDEVWDAIVAGIPLRVGTAYRVYGLLYSHRVYDHRRHGKFHEAEYGTRQVGSVLGEEMPTELPRPATDPAAVRKVRDLLAGAGISPGTRYLIVHPGTAGNTIEWSSQRYGQAAARLLADRAVQAVVLTGTESERGRCEIVAGECPGTVSLCGILNLTELIALIADASLFMGGSTGPLHLAAALRTPVVGLYPNRDWMSPRRWRPWSRNAAVLAPPPDGPNPDDMDQISVDAVVDAAARLLRVPSLEKSIS